MLKIKSIKPLYTQIVTTGNKYEDDLKQGGVIIANKGSLKLYQTVVAVGPMVRDVKEGDQVMLDYSAYEVKRYDKNSIQNDMDNNKTIRLDLPWVTIEKEEGNPQDYLLLSDRDIRYVFDGYEVEDEQGSSLILPEKKLIIS